MNNKYKTLTLPCDIWEKILNTLKDSKDVMVGSDGWKSEQLQKLVENFENILEMSEEHNLEIGLANK